MQRRAWALDVLRQEGVRSVRSSSFSSLLAITRKLTATYRTGPRHRLWIRFPPRDACYPTFHYSRTSHSGPHRIRRIAPAQSGRQRSGRGLWVGTEEGVVHKGVYGLTAARFLFSSAHRFSFILQSTTFLLFRSSGGHALNCPAHTWCIKLIFTGSHTASRRSRFFTLCNQSRSFYHLAFLLYFQLPTSQTTVGTSHHRTLPRSHREVQCKIGGVRSHRRLGVDRAFGSTRIE